MRSVVHSLLNITLLNSVVAVRSTVGMGKQATRKDLMAFFTLLAGLALAASVSAESMQQSDEQFYREILASLKTDTGVIPTMPDVHPVRTLFNPEAVIPPQCYTRTEGSFNPCYVCHQDVVPGRENTMNDGGLQIAYSFSDVGMTNHWKNLFEDRSAEVAKISDQEIRTWIDQDNYSALAPRLRNAGFSGWIPDLKNLQRAAGAFDELGFALDGSHWVAFNYKPLPSTFWPTNGATDDVMIRLPGVFRTTKKGDYSRDIYLANLAIVEANLKNLERISTPSINEEIIGKDLNGDGRLTEVNEIVRQPTYVGAAAPEYRDSFLYPEGTEFLHTVRYIGTTPVGEIVPSTRIKEVRYMRKTVAYRKTLYARGYQLEGYAKEVGQLPQYQYLGDNGLDNGFGWALQGFIENAQGELRTLTYEENLACMGCHSSIGSTIDKTFSLPRKIDGAKGWGYINLKGMPDAPNRTSDGKSEERGEIASYLERVGGGGEFRSNPEMFARWFDSEGKLDRKKVAQARDVYELITPSPERALILNKAYRVIVAEQDYIYGRDATVVAPHNVYEKIDNTNAPTLPPALFQQWDIRLDWQAVEK